MKLTKSSLEGLNQLYSLDLFLCDLSRFDFKLLYSPNLTILKIVSLSSQIDLSHLTNLKWLSLLHVESLSCIVNLNQKLSMLEINHSCLTRKEMNKFFVNLKLPTLVSLNLESNKLCAASKKWFSHCPNLKYLWLRDNCIEDLDFLQCEWLASLECLDLSENKIKELRYGQFSRLSKLKVVELACNPHLKLDSRVFDDLNNLKYFSLNYSTTDDY